MITYPTSPLAVPLPSLPAVPGVRLASIEAGLRYSGRLDLTLMEFAPSTTIAGVFTQNKCPGAPIDWCRAILPKGHARGLLVNAGIANVFTGKAGFEAVQRSAEAAANAIGCSAEEIFIASTGVIGEQLPYQKIVDNMPKLYQNLDKNQWKETAQAILTTDTFAKGYSLQTKIGTENVTIQGIAKGSGMIAPDMATMLSFVTTDAKLPASVLQTLLSEKVKTTFNAITVDSDTSTSDTLLLFATGVANTPEITNPTDPRLTDFANTLEKVLKELALLVIKDGEGVSKLIEITVTGAINNDSAHKIGMCIGNSPLVKTAITGEDANWGRVVMAVGKAGEPANRDSLSVAIGDVWVAHEGGVLMDYDRDTVAQHMKEETIKIKIDLNLGSGKATIWSCNLTKGYIDINGSYLRS
ncbi:bifunctional glutamate N-acetyltransferase/amino-acid acetyltransferase ArgJ [Commensalibacter nepenthis]|uniref:Arginine biosynthesis bifunctional protein ArgJ n=1 Tax=Commensalibacter nepenthis TaxID=3043872 RepID=A0ABT6Q954_9PROT|nr:bifunctional glutamate N-acetyltransferase/amino-acid acetyltransferase ArgJ [Commensalibacter sp. TBRC 10068]MDI2113339.1 bifunctional glutamate N-acetyltransferase/amino-acid acetyltransferase ArgJ [Commensalibacter sp. TBRC 10068]